MSKPFIVTEEVNMVNCIETHTIHLLSFVRGPSLCHREKAGGIYIQYILLASRYVLVSTFSSTWCSCTIYMLKNIVCLHCDHSFFPFFLFRMFVMKEFTFTCCRFLDGAETKERRVILIAILYTEAYA